VVITLPMLIPNASAIKRTVGLICLDIYITSGTPSKATVSFTKNAEIIPKPITNTSSIDFNLLPVLDSIFAATNLRTPDLSRDI